MCCGFPEKNIDFSKGYLDTGASAYFTSASNDNRYEHYKLNKEDWIIVDMEGKGVDITTSEKTKINDHFWGLSGCGLWLLLFTKDPNSGQYTCEYKLIGIMTEFKKSKYYCLIGNRIHLFIEAFKILENMKFSEIPVPSYI